ncbi:hypothetical protein HPG69_006773 [Diceros bicornis minor]|uniref:BTB domain-containing protein n=1 Tax=Diceros bicornis minor TaxID=77932 RepID=A0A7J7F2T2_DICBM|nr:hypothetical protein HPG69_006773 [Diceros bicornis minor]
MVFAVEGTEVPCHKVVLAGLLVSLHYLTGKRNLGTHSNLAINESTVEQFYETMSFLQNQNAKRLMGTIPPESFHAAGTGPTDRCSQEWKMRGQLAKPLSLDALGMTKEETMISSKAPSEEPCSLYFSIQKVHKLCSPPADLHKVGQFHSKISKDPDAFRPHKAIFAKSVGREFNQRTAERHDTEKDEQTRVSLLSYAQQSWSTLQLCDNTEPLVESLSKLQLLVITFCIKLPSDTVDGSPVIVENHSVNKSEWEMTNIPAKFCAFQQETHLKERTKDITYQYDLELIRTRTVVTGERFSMHRGETLYPALKNLHGNH